MARVQLVGFRLGISMKIVRCRSAVPCRTALYGPDSKTTPKPNQVEPVACAKTVIWGADENNNIDSGCSQTIWLKEDQPTTVPQTAIAVQPYCDWGGTVSPADIIGIRALFLGVLLFLLTYIGAVFAIRVNYKRRMTTHAAELEMLQPKMNDVREDMHSVVERRWCGLPVEAGPPHDSMNHNGPKFETGSLLELNTAAKPGKPPMTSADHKRRFASGSWRYRLRLMAGLRARKKAMVASRIRHQAVMMGVSYLLLIVSIMCLVLLIQPLNYVDYAPRAFLDPIIHPATRNSGEGVYAWLDLLAFSDYIVEFIVLTIGILTSAYKMKTGNQLGKKEGRPHDLNTASTGVSPPSRDVELGVDSPVRQISDDVEHDPIFPESVCAIVLLPGNGACTWSVDARSNLVRCLTRLIDIGLPARQIFVVDCGSGLTPIDDTWRVIHTVVSPDINYSYLPENNRILGAYWANKIWIPYAGKKAAAASGMKTGSSGVFESKSEGSPNVTFRYALIVDDIETVLPSTFDLRSLNLGESKPAAVHFPVTIDPRNRPTEDLAKFADMRLMLQCAHINLQANLLGGALSTQRGISLWHRGALDKVLYEHGTEPFAVCGIFAGLLMLRQRDEDIIKTAVQLAPETFGNSPYVDVGFQPKDIIEYVAQETEAAAPARFLMLYFRELLWVPSFTHMRSVFFKPFLFFVPILSGILDFLRPLILCSLVFRDPLSLLVMLIVLAIFSWLLALLIMASHRKGSSRIRRAGTAYGLRGFLLHPFFQFINSLTRMAGHFVLLFGSNWQERALTGDENSLRVGLRVDDIRDIPPCPPSTEVDWFSVWAGAGPQGTGDHRHHADREMSED
ncbi:hypothetical protein FOL47_002384 [Perkinsus chesapeaki]|uniref:Uncharacterized protein n=1 Tax=Perkinsus chesapeaki TaxID=330153 RepID=A0A7J6ME54_PERCH|nr:hypothetical protein FOL47_002384 [Perkinsus chesapeaki]